MGSEGVTMSRSFRVFVCFLSLSALALSASLADAELKQKINKAAKQIACDVCKETDEERIEKYIDNMCTVNGLQDEHTIKEVGESQFAFRRKTMEDYEAEGGVVETVTNPDGTTSQSMKMEQTVQSTVSNNGAKIPADPKTWIGFAIQQGCRKALMKRSGGSRMSFLLFRKFWPEEDPDEDDQERVQSFASSEETLRKHICMETSKVCSSKKTGSNRTLSPTTSRSHAQCLCVLR